MPPEQTSPRFFSVKTLILFIGVVVISAGIYLAFWQRQTTRKQLVFSSQMQQSITKILGHSSVYGFVVGVQEDGFFFTVHGIFPFPKLFARVSNQTKFFQRTEGENEKKIPLSRTDIKTDDAIMVITDSAIGSRTTIDAVEVIKFVR